MNKITRICIFVLLVSVALFCAYICYANMAQAIIFGDYYSNPEMWTVSHDNISIAKFKVGDYAAKAFLSGMILLVDIIVLLSNMRGFFPQNLEKKEMLKRKRLQQYQEKIEKMKGDE